MSQRLILLLFLLVTGLNLSAQDGEEFNQLFGEALHMEEERFNKNAGELWHQLHDMEPENANINFRLGLSYLNSNVNKYKSLDYLKLIQPDQLTGNFDYYDPSEKKAPFESYYYLAHSYHINTMLDSAEAVYHRLEGLISKKHFMRPLISHQLEMIENARYQLANPKDYSIENLGETINTEFSEFSPVISLDESGLYFTSTRIRKDSSNWDVVDQNYGNYFDDVYVSYRDKDKMWGEPELLNINEINKHTATINVSPDGQHLYVYISSGPDGNVYESSLIGEVWGEPVQMTHDVNSDAWETHIAMSADGNTMYFVSDRSGGEGERDLYRSVILPNGEWSKAKSLGDVVNTEWDEEAPFIHPDGRTLYFSSKGHNSMGGFDIFYTTLQEDGSWTVPENVGYPLNTCDDDLYFVTTPDGLRGYFSSDRPGGFGNDDLYIIYLPESVNQGLAVLKGYIYPHEGQTLPSNLSIEVTDLETGIVTYYTPRMRDGGYVIILPPCKEYDINYLQDETSIHKEKYYVPCESSYQELHKELFLNPLEVGGVEKIIPPTDEVADSGAETGVGLIPIGTRTDKEVIAKSEEHFGYNQTSMEVSAANFKKFMEDLKAATEKYEFVEVTIEGSASKVPTKTFKTNDNLARTRATEAETKLKAALASYGIDSSKVRVVAINSLTQGPDYKWDAVTNKAVYEQYQYVILKAYH
jgi:hypothetical protein